MKLALFLGTFSLIGLVYVFIGWWASRGMKTQTDFYLAGRGLGLGLLTFTLVGTHIGGGMILGTAAQAYDVGLYGLLYNLGLCAGFLVICLGFAGKMREFNVSTTAELFEKMYGSTALRQMSSVILIATLCGILASQVLAARSVFAGLGLHSELLFLLFWMVIVVYTVVGGLKAVVVTDFFQVLLIVLIFGVLFGFALFNQPASFSHILSVTKAASRNSISFGAIFGYFFTPFLFMFIEQDIAQYFFAAKSKRIATLGAFLAGLFIIGFSLLPVYFGVQARVSNIPMAVGANPLVSFIDVTMGEVIGVFVACGLFAAILSTSDSLLCAISSHIAYDFAPHFGRVKNKLRLSQYITFGVSIFSLILAYYFTDILELLRQSYELAVGCLFVSIFACFFREKLNARSAWISIVSGVLAFAVIRGEVFVVPSWLPREVIMVTASVVGYIIGMYSGGRHKPNVIHVKS